MKPKERASKKQQELLKFVDDFIKANGYGPSYREIMRGLEYKSVSTVAIHIENLIAKGYLLRRDKSARSLEVISLTTQSAAAEKSSDLEEDLKRRIATQNLAGEDLLVVSSALRLLGFNRLAEQTASEGEDSDASES